MNKIEKIKILCRECLKGKSLGRTLHNIYLRDLIPFEGKGIDFGAKNATSSYYRFINVENAELTYTDLYSKNTDKVKSIDFEREFDLSSESYDFALVMNTLEHIYNHQEFVNNVSNSIKSNGRLEGFVPFLHHYHQDPDDYFRYTHSALKRILENANFDNIKITPICKGGFSVSASLISRILKIKIFVLIWWLIAILLDKPLNKIWSVNKDIYGGLAFSAIKSEASNT